MQGHPIFKREATDQLLEPRPLRPVAVAIEPPAGRGEFAAGPQEHVDPLAMNELPGGDKANDAVGCTTRSRCGERWHVKKIAERHNLFFRKPDPAKKLTAHSTDRQHECKPVCPASREHPAPEPLEPADLPRLFGGLRKDRQPGGRRGEPAETRPDQRVGEETGKHVERR